MVHLVVQFKKKQGPKPQVNMWPIQALYQSLTSSGDFVQPICPFVTSLHHACYCTHTHAHSHTWFWRSTCHFCMWWIMKVPFFQGIWIRSAKLTSKPKKIRTVGFISWLKRAEKSPNFRGVVFPSACHATKCNEVSWVSRILSGQIKTRSQHHQPWNCHSTYHGLRSIG